MRPWPWVGLYIVIKKYGDSVYKLGHKTKKRQDVG